MPTKNTNPNQQETKKNSDGGLWNKVSKANNPYLFGKLTLKTGETVLFRAMPNTYKQAGENTPDYKIFINDDAEIKTKPVVVKKPKVVESVTEDSPENEDNEEGKF